MANEQINQLAALPLPVQPTDKLIVQRGAARATALEVQNSGLVTGPAVATDSAVALYDGVTGKLLKDGPVLGGAALLNVGAIAGTVAAGNDARFTDARTPTAHATTHVTGGTDVIASAVAGGNAGLMTGTDKTKLDGIEAGADVTDAGNVGTAIDGSAAKVTPVDADVVPILDSAAANILKKVTWANVKATLKTYFDTLYATAASIVNMVTSAAVIGDTKLVVGSGGARGVAESSLSGIPLLTAGVPTASNVTNDVQTKAAIVPNTAPAAGEIPVGNAGGTAYAKAAVSGDATLASTGALTIANAAVTLAKMANLAQDQFIGRTTASTGVPQTATITAFARTMLDDVDAASVRATIGAGTGSGTVTNVSGTAPISSSGGATPAISLDNAGVTFAKIQDIATDSLIGRDTAGTGVPENILLNATLSMDGSGNLRRAALTGDVTASAGSNATTLAAGSASNLDSGTLLAARMPALTGDVTTTVGTVATTLATVNGNVGSFGSATQSLTLTANAKGLITAVAAQTVTPAVGSITGLGTGVATALAVNVGTAGSPVVNGGAGGTPSSIALANATGLLVAGGGTGIATTTAYSPVFSGTTATGAWKADTGPGTAGHVFTSNGAGAYPTWQAAAGGSFSVGKVLALIQGVPLP